MAEIKYDFSELTPLLYENRIDNFLELDGDADYVEIGNVSELNFDETESFTVEAWVYTDQDPGVDLNNVVTKQTLEAGTGKWALTLNGSNRPGLFLNDGTNEVIVGNWSTNPLATGEWHHLAGALT